MRTLSDAKRNLIAEMLRMSPVRRRFLKQSSYYYRDLLAFLRFNIPENSRVLEIGCGTGHIVSRLQGSFAVGADISAPMLNIAREDNPGIHVVQIDAEKLAFKTTFDHVVISDTLGYLEDIQQALCHIQKVCRPDTRVIITFHSFLWQPALKLAELLGLKMPQKRLNWLNRSDVANLLHLSGFEIVKEGRRFLCPRNIPVIGWFLNTCVAHLPLFNRLCITGYVIARTLPSVSPPPPRYSVSVIVPARNEKGNIAQVLQRVPLMGSSTEILFVEGHSDDDTLEEIRRACAEHTGITSVRYAVQPGKGKGDAVRLGFSIAQGDILMILDADLTVQPEELPKFYDAIASGTGEFINGSRLVYPVEKEAMRLLNTAGNTFFSIMFSWLLGQRFKDTLCGTKVLFRTDWSRINAGRSHFGEFDPFGDFDLIFGAAKLNLKIVEIPVRYKARRYGTTNISRFRHGWLLLKMVVFALRKMKFR